MPAGMCSVYAHMLTTYARSSTHIHTHTRWAAARRHQHRPRPPRCPAPATQGERHTVCVSECVHVCVSEYVVHVCARANTNSTNRIPDTLHHTHTHTH